MQKPSFFVNLAAVGSILVIAVPVNAQDKAELRKEAATQVAALRNLGEPKDRCSMKANFGEAGIIILTENDSALATGDKLVSINGITVSGSTIEEISAILRQISPNTKIPVSVTRNGALISMELECGNSRPFFENAVKALDAAAKGKFDECVAAFEQIPAHTSYVAIVKTQCAITSKNSKKYNIPQMSFETVRLMIDDAYWLPSYRPTALQRLHTIESYMTTNLGAAKYQELVALTKKWPGDEQAFEKTMPDWTKFRRAAEYSIKAKLIDPDSAKIDWPRGFIFGTWKPFLGKRHEGYWTCGNVNARNRMGGFAGTTSFVVVLDSSGSVLFSEMGTGEEYDLVSTQCANSLKLLPAAPAEFTNNQISSQPTTISVADELQKLLELKNTGAITTLEFEAAKRKLLGT